MFMDKKDENTNLKSENEVFIDKLRGKLDENKIQDILNKAGENNIVDFVAQYPERFNEDELTIVKETLSAVITNKAIKQCKEELNKIEKDNGEKTKGKITIENIEQVTEEQKLPDIKEETKATGQLFNENVKGELENDSNDERA